MPCNCPSCRRDNILNGTLIEKCGCCQKDITAQVPFKVMGDNTLVCGICHQQHYDTCNNCNKFFKKTEMREMIRNGETKRACKRCFEQYYRECTECHQWVDRH